MNKVNKKEMVKSYTSTNSVLELKRQLKTYKRKVNDVKKQIKHEKDMLKYFSKYPHQGGKTLTTLKGIQKSINLLEDFLEVYEVGVAATAKEIQLQRQEVFESLTGYHPDKEIAKKRIVKERATFKGGVNDNV